MGVADCFFERTDQSFTAVEAKSMARATPQQHVTHCLFGSLQSFLVFAVPNIFFPDSQGRQRLCCLHAAGHHQLIAAL
jgi:hypothetical protein